MKKLLIAFTILMIACNSQEKNVMHTNHNPYDTPVIPMKDAKWKADDATKRNAYEMIRVVNDSSYQSEAHRQLLYTKLQSTVDTMIKQCRMKGPDHDALHRWLEKVLHGMNSIKDDKSDYPETYSALKNDIESFEETFK